MRVEVWPLPMRTYADFLEVSWIYRQGAWPICTNTFYTARSWKTNVDNRFFELHQATLVHKNLFSLCFYDSMLIYPKISS